MALVAVHELLIRASARGLVLDVDVDRLVDQIVRIRHPEHLVRTYNLLFGLLNSNWLSDDAYAKVRDALFV